MRPLAICPAIHLRAVRVTAEANALLRLYLEVAIRAVSASGNIEIVHDRSQHVRPDAFQAAQSFWLLIFKIGDVKLYHFFTILGTSVLHINR